MNKDMERIRVCVVQPLLWAIGWRQRCASSSHPDDLGPHSPQRAGVLPAGWLIARSSLRNCPWTREAALLQGWADAVPDSMPPSGIPLKSRSSFRAPHGIGLDFCGHCIIVQCSPLPRSTSLICFQQLCPTGHPHKLPSRSLFPRSPPMKVGARCHPRK